MAERSIVKRNTIDWYLEKIEELGWIEFDCIKVFCTFGSPRPPYAHQFIAYCKARSGIDDEPWDGVGGTPFEAVRDLYKSLKEAETETQEEEE